MMNKSNKPSIFQNTNVQIAVAVAFYIFCRFAAKEILSIFKFRFYFLCIIVSLIEAVAIMRHSDKKYKDPQILLKEGLMAVFGITAVFAYLNVPIIKTINSVLDISTPRIYYVKAEKVHASERTVRTKSGSREVGEYSIEFSSWRPEYKTLEIDTDRDFVCSTYEGTTFRIAVKRGLLGFEFINKYEKVYGLEVSEKAKFPMTEEELKAAQKQKKKDEIEEFVKRQEELTAKNDPKPKKKNGLATTQHN